MRAVSGIAGNENQTSHLAGECDPVRAPCRVRGVRILKHMYNIQFFKNLRILLHFHLILLSCICYRQNMKRNLQPLSYSFLFIRKIPHHMKCQLCLEILILPVSCPPPWYSYSSTSSPGPSWNLNLLSVYLFHDIKNSDDSNPVEIQLTLKEVSHIFFKLHNFVTKILIVLSFSDSKYFIVNLNFFL